MCVAVERLYKLYIAAAVCMKKKTARSHFDGRMVSLEMFACLYFINQITVHCIFGGTNRPITLSREQGYAYRDLG